MQRIASNRKSSAARFMQLWLFYYLYMMVNGILIAKGSFITKAVGVAVFAIIFFYTINNFRHTKIFSIIYFYVAYLALSIFFLSSDFGYSYRMYAKYAGALLCLPLAFNLTSEVGDIRRISKFFVIFAALFVINFFMANALNFSAALGYGESRYGGEGADTGALFDDSLYTNVLALIMLPFILISISKRKNILLVLYLLCLAITIICLKRTVLFGLAVCMLFFIGAFIFFNTKYKKYKFTGSVFSKKQTLVAVIGIILVVTIFSDVFFRQVEARGRRFEEGYDYSQEGRFVELGMIFNDIVNNDSKMVTIFGRETFNTVGTYSLSATGSINDRMIHENYGIIINGGGLFGLSFHLIVLFFPLYLFWKYTSKIPLRNLPDRLLYIAFLSIWGLSIIASFSGTIWLCLYPSMTYVLEGAILRYFYDRKRIGAATSHDKLK